MDRDSIPSRLRVEDFERLLDVTRALAHELDLDALLTHIVDAARALLDAERGSVFLYDAKTGELYTKVATGSGQIRVPPGRGIVGESAQTRAVINVPDCYADSRFDRSFDQRTGFRTRCLLTVPLIGHDDALVGVMQVLNRRGGPFGPQDERVATALAAQCAVALQRSHMLKELLEKQKMERELQVAREIQMRFLPQKMPDLPPYEFAGWMRPADETGGDVFDTIPAGGRRVALLLGDATGHGIGPALSVTQVRSMLRIALRLDAQLDAAFKNINDQLAADLSSNRFVTAFVGVLDADAHEMRFHSAGQSPVLHLVAATGEARELPTTALPLGMFAGFPVPDPPRIDLAPGDIVALVTDGVFEREAEGGEQFGTDRVAELLRELRSRPLDEVIGAIVAAADAFGGTSPQADDMTLLLVRRGRLP
jgi:phosphoserine phosphatase